MRATLVHHWTTGKRSAAAVSLSLVAVLGSAPAQPPGFRAETVVSDLGLASAMAFAPDGRLFVLERVTGQVLVVEGGAVARVWATVPVTTTQGESKGLLGVAVDPDFLRNGYVYVSASDWQGLGQNALVRLQEVGGVGTNPTRIGPQTAVTRIHNIGPVTFGVDGKLYVSFGDGRLGAPAQKLATAYGKILRMNAPGGSIPADNPFASSHVWSYGHRNAFGLAVHPATGQLYQTENGAMLEDEVNRIVKGGNYGWPMHEGTELVPDPGAEDPLWVWGPPIAPTGSCFYTGELYPSLYHAGWFAGDWNQGLLQLLDLDPTGTTVLGTAVLHDYGRRLLGVVNGPDGNLWTLYSGPSGSPRGADRIDRIVYDPGPKPSVAVTALSHVVVGGSMTVGVTGSNGDLALAWVGATRSPLAVPTPFGSLWVSIDLILPPLSIQNDNRAYLGLSVPSSPGIVGAVLHVQAGTWSGSAVQLTNADSLVLH